MDLQRATEDTFEVCLRNAETSAMFEALKNSDPPIDHLTRWRDDFQPSLERIASRPSRKSQAAECRKILVEGIEKRSLLWVLIGIHDADIREALVYTFFEDLALQGVPNVLQLVTQQYLYYLLDGIALTILHTQQFNSTIKIATFDTSYDAMCKVSAEIMVKKVMASRIFGPETPGGQAYRNTIVEPLEGRLKSIKRSFRENLSLLSPTNPDNSEFVDFLSTYSKQLDELKHARGVV